MKLKDLKAGDFFFFDGPQNDGWPFKLWWRVSWLEGDGVTQTPRFLFARRVTDPESNDWANHNPIPFTLSRHGDRTVRTHKKD